MSISDERVIELADVLAWHLFQTSCDANELKKSLEYYRASEDRTQFFQMLNIRRKNPGLFQRSDETHKYYQEIHCKAREVLGLTGMNSRDDLQVLGWAFRLLRFYNEEKPSHPVTQLPTDTEQRPQ